MSAPMERYPVNINVRGGSPWTIWLTRELIEDACKSANRGGALTDEDARRWRDANLPEIIELAHRLVDDGRAIPPQIVLVSLDWQTRMN